MRRPILTMLAAGIACAIGATTAASAGGPSPGIAQGTHGLVRGNLTYLTQADGTSTSIQVVNRDGGVLRSMKLAGTWGLPLVDFHQTTDGLFPNGRTLLLAQPLFNGQGALRQTTTFKLVDVKQMKLSGTIRLQKPMAFDAVSPNGRYLYLIEYVSPEDAGLYRVRAYDLNRSRLLPKIIADRRSWATGMQGSPISRLWKQGWAYTLYGGNARPFIHALDARHLQAVCINLPWKTSPQRLFDYRLRSDGDGHLVVRGPHGRALAVVDRKTFRVLRAVQNPQ